MAFDIISGLTMALVIITGYYACEVRKQTILFRQQTRVFLNDAKRNHLVNELSLLVMPLLRLKYCVEVNPLYWNWHDAIIVKDEHLDQVYINNINEINNIIKDIMYYRYASRGNLQSTIKTYLDNLQKIERMRSRYSKTLAELEAFTERDEVKLAYDELKNTQDIMFAEANNRYNTIQELIRNL